MKKILAALIVFIQFSIHLSAQIKMGNYNVGFKFYLENDFSRSFGNTNDSVFSPRPIQINVWYPATAKGIKMMKIADYCNLYPYQYNFSRKTKKEIENNISTWRGVFSSRGVTNPDSLLKQKTNAYSDAAFPKMKFPVVIYIPGAEGEAFENFVLCEYLASNGFVVVSCPSFGAYDDKTSVYPLGIEMQVADINFLYGYLSKLPFADKANVNLSGFSMGGFTTIIFNMRKLERFKSLVSIDGSIRTHYSKALRVPEFNPQMFRTPFFLFASNGDNWSDTLFINKLKFANTTLAKIDSFGHLDFTSYNYFGNGEMKRRLYENFCLLTKLFLENPDDNTISKFEKAGDKQIKLSFKPSVPIKLLSGNEFKKLIEEKGVDVAKQYYNEIRKVYPSLQPFDEYEFTVLAFNYFNERKKPDDAIGIMQLVTDAYPESYEAVGLLGRLYEKNKDKKNAALYFGKALDMAKKMEYKTPSVFEDIEYYVEKVKTNSQ